VDTPEQGKVTIHCPFPTAGVGFSANQPADACIQYLMVANLQNRDAPTRTDFHDAISARGDRWYAACLRITRDRDLAEDAVQDALLSAWNKRHQFDQSARLETWIHRIAVNAALQLLRKTRPDTFDTLDEDVADDGDTPETATAARELGNLLSAALARLSEMERVCFVLKHLEQWRLAEIAEELGTNDGRVKQAVFRAVRKLRPQIASLQGELQ